MGAIERIDEYLKAGKRVFLREPGSKSSTDSSKVGRKYGEPLGWFATKDNMAFGWTIYELDNADKAWFSSEKVSTKGVFRIVSHNGNTTLVKFDLSKNKVWFFDNEEYEKTNDIVFEKKPVTFDRLFIDDKKEKYFEV